MRFGLSAFILIAVCANLLRAQVKPLEDAAGSKQFAWSENVDFAARKAQRTNRLLLVLHHDVALNEALESVGLADKHCRTVIANRFVAVRREHGSLPPVDDAPRRAPALLLFFCSPRQEVLHVVVGRCSPEHLLQAVAWASALHGSLPKSPAERSRILSVAHRGRLEPRVLKRLTAEVGSVWRDGRRGELSVADVRAASAEAKKTRDEFLRQRFASGYRPELWLKMSPSVASHADIAPDLGHLAMSELAGLPYGLMAGPMMQQLTGRVERPKSDPSLTRAAASLARINQKAGRPTVLLIDEPQLNGASAKFTVAAKLPKHPLIDSQRAEFAVIRVKRDSLFEFLEASKVAVGDKRVFKAALIILDRRGRIEASFSSQPGVAELAKIMRRAARRLAEGGKP